MHRSTPAARSKRSTDARLSQPEPLQLTHRISERRVIDYSGHALTYQQLERLITSSGK
jgi:hypothetical protein